MRRTRTVLLITMIILGFNTNALAARPFLKVVTEEFPPYNYTVNGNIKGISTSVVTETLKRSGLTYRIQVYPWKRAYRAIALREKNVLIYSIYRSAEREPLFAAWIGPILPPAAIYFYKLEKRADIVVDSLNAAKNYTIGVMRDDFTHEFLNKHYFPRLDIASDELSNTRKFLSGRVDLIPAYELTLAARLQQLDTPFRLVKQVFTLVPAEASKTYMALSRGTDPELTAKLKAAFEQVEADGVIDKVLDAYLKSIR